MVDSSGRARAVGMPSVIMPLASFASTSAGWETKSELDKRSMEATLCSDEKKARRSAGQLPVVWLSRAPRAGHLELIYAGGLLDHPGFGCLGTLLESCGIPNTLDDPGVLGFFARD
eukprot:4701314-Pyramimonas_sp.AAC.1